MEEKDRHIITFDMGPEEEPTPKAEPEAPKAEAPVEKPDFVLTPSEPEAPKTESENEGLDFILKPSAPEAKVETPSFEMKVNEPKDEKSTETIDMKPTPEATPVVEGSGFTMSPSPIENKAHELRHDFDDIGRDVKVSMSEDIAKATGAAAFAAKPEEKAAPTVNASTTVAGSSPVSEGSGGGGNRTGGNHSAQKPAKQKKKKEKKYVTRGTLIGCMILTMLLSTFLGSFLGAGLGSLNSNNSGNRAERDDSKLSQLNLGDATGSELTVAEIIEKNADAVVEIVVSGTTQGMWGQLQLTEGAGSGVIIRKDGYIATNYHVIQGANKVQVTLHNGESYPAQIIGSDPSNDVAVIKIDEKDLTTAVIGDSSKVEVGDLAVAIGNPLGQLGGTATTGIISALDRTLSVEGTTLTLLQTDAAINGGNSGGGLFNSMGELIGIVESKASAVGVEGLAFALPINSVAEIINDIIESGGNVGSKTAGTPAVGVVIRDVSEEQSQYYGLDEPGVYIAQVTGVNAQKAGFKEQDRIVSFNGTEIDDSSTFITLVRKCKVGDVVTVVVSRQGQQIEIKTELEELQTQQ